MCLSSRSGTGRGRGGEQFDFGLARVVKRRNRVNARYEMTGETGSMRYMAPEVRRLFFVVVVAAFFFYLAQFYRGIRLSPLAL